MSPGLLLVALLLAGGSPLEDQLPWDGVSVREVRDAASGLRFPVPLTGALLQTRHFPTATPGAQMRHVFSLASVEGEVLEVGVFENPRGLSLEAFVEKALLHLTVTEHARMPSTATRARVPSLVFEHPRSGQQYARRTAVFALGTRLVVVSCRNVEDRFSAGAFAAVLDGLEEERR